MSSPNSPNLIYPKADLSLATITPYTQAADGSWTAVGAGYNLLGYLDSIIPDLEQMLMEALSVDAGYMNRLPTIIDGSVVVTENVRRASSTTSGPFLELTSSYGMACLQWAYQTIGSHNTKFTFYGLWERFTGGTVQGIGMQKAGMVLRMLDTSYTTVGGTIGLPPFSMVRV